MSNIYEFIFYFPGGAVTGLYWFALKTYRSHPREIMLHTRFFFYHILKKKKNWFTHSKSLQFTTNEKNIIKKFVYAISILEINFNKLFMRN